MWFSNSDQAQGYALAQGEISAANARVAAQNFQAALDARRAEAVHHALSMNVHQLREALAAETERAQAYQHHADELCSALQDAAAAMKHLAAELAKKDQLLAAEISWSRHLAERLQELEPPF